jgi:adenylate kinase
MTGDNKSHKRCFVVGITGPSGSGKSTLTQCLADQLSGFLVSEDPKFFLAPAAASYEHRDPMSETPSHVDWDAYITHLRSEITNCNTRILLVEHFWLLHDARVVQELDGILFLDTFGLGVGNSVEIVASNGIPKKPIQKYAI